MVTKRLLERTAGVLFFGILFSLMVSVCAMAQSESAVFDQAGLLEQAQIGELQKKVEALTEKYSMNLILLTVQEADGKSSKEYAEDFYSEKGYEQSGAKGGAVLMIDMDNRQIYVATNGEMIRYLTDKHIEQIIDSSYDYIKSGDYKACFETMLSGTEGYLKQGIGKNQKNYDTETKKMSEYRNLSGTDWLIAVVSGLVLAGGVCIFTVGKYRMKWGNYTYPYQQKSEMSLNVKQDRFLRQVVTQRRIPRNTDQSGPSGGGGGISSTHTSSGGGTFGGGGREF